MELKKIARKMRIEARQTGKSQVSLENGLTLTLRWHKKAHTWALSLTRLYRQAPQQEQDDCLRDFNIPADRQWQPMYRHGYGIIRFTWREEVPVQAHFLNQ